MAYSFSPRSLKAMAGVHPDLIAVMELALKRSPIDFMVLEGVRDVARQKVLVARGASKTFNSRHLTGHAIDIAPLDGGEVSWDWPLYHKLAPTIKAAAADLGVDIEWGGDWTSFKDGPHWQLSWATYSKTDMEPRASLDREMTEIVTAPQHQGHKVPEVVEKLAKDAHKAPVKSTTNWAVLIGMAQSVWVFFQTADPMVQAAAILGVAVLAYILRERIRKASLGKRAKEALGL